ncbi:VOC family protein [Sanguibacter suarezii]|uniref:VOC family protein n=1 Tax=Sanguibacter suarezii TaxID=60921 RepID=UPI000834667C|nr:VOC family protein [Sanguibacter suarezii]
MPTLWTLTIDCTSPAVLSAFWKAALGYVDAPPPSGFATWHDWYVACEVPEDEWDDGASIVDPTGTGPRISMLKVPESKAVKNRLHLDLQVSGGRAQPQPARTERIRGMVDRLTAIGAHVLGEHHVGNLLDHVVLADPEGNEFCVV